MTQEALPDHIRKPHLRPIQPIPIQRDGKQFVALRDPLLNRRQSMVVSPQMMPILQQLQGEADLVELAGRFKIDLEKFVELAEGLDRMGLLWGPTFDELEGQLKTSLREAGAFPSRVSASLGDDDGACRAALDAYIEESEDPEMETAIVGLVAPHLDYERGWPNYAAAYRCLDRTDTPDRIVILGTNHFGLGDGVVLTEFGFRTPMGMCPCDQPVIESLKRTLGDGVVVDQLDHMPEHSVELQVPWIQHRFGDVPVVAALIPDPLVPMIADDGARIGTEAFVDALRAALDEHGGRTFFIASSDLSHVGPQFGEPRAVDDQRRMDVERHDRDMLAKFITGDAEEFIGAMRWNKNPTRWCSIGSMAAVLALAGDADVELIDYRQALDDRGSVMVTSAALALLEPEG